MYQDTNVFQRQHKHQKLFTKIRAYLGSEILSAKHFDLNKKLEQFKQNKSIDKLTVNSERDDTRDDLTDLLDSIGGQTLVISSIISGDSFQPESGSFTKTLCSLLEYQQVK